MGWVSYTSKLPLHHRALRVKQEKYMNCSCGGSTEYEHKVVRDKEVIATYQKCPGCGRVLITRGEDAIKAMIEAENQGCPTAL